MQVLFARAALLLTLAAAPAFSQTVAVIGLDTLQFESSKSNAVAANKLGEVSAAISQQLKNDLIATRKFKVLDYVQTSSVLAEYGLTVEAVTANNNSDTLFDTAGLDYVLRATVAGLEAGAESASITLDLFSTSYTLTDLNAQSVLKLDATTSEVSSSVATITNSIVNETVASVFPLRVMGNSKDGIVTVNYGNGLLHKGDELTVFSAVAKPNTGAVEAGSAKGDEVATLEVISSNEKFSIARIIDGEENLGSGLKAKVIN